MYLGKHMDLFFILNNRKIFKTTTYLLGCRWSGGQMHITCLSKEARNPLVIKNWKQWIWCL